MAMPRMITLLTFLFGAVSLFLMDKTWLNPTKKTNHEAAQSPPNR